MGGENASLGKNIFANDYPSFFSISFDIIDFSWSESFVRLLLQLSKRGMVLLEDQVFGVKVPQAPKYLSDFILLEYSCIPGC